MPDNNENNKDIRKSIIDEFRDILKGELDNAESEGNNQRADVLKFHLHKNRSKSGNVTGIMDFNNGTLNFN